jgi:uncharacterized protein (DUF4213/DUF364 family)
MSILEEAAQLVKQKLNGDFEDITIEKVVIGLFFTAVKLSSGAGGVCYTPIKDIPQAVCCPSSAGRIFDPDKIIGMKAKDSLIALSSPEPIKTAVAISTLNALSATCWARGLTGDYHMRMNMDAQDAVRMPAEKSVAVVGAFLPTLRALKKRGGQWWVIEQDPNTLKGEELAHFVPAEKSETIVSTADVLIITGVTLVNHTLEGILGAAKVGAEIAVMGPTASLLPEPLFDRNVRIVGGVWVKKPDQLLDCVAAGGSGYHFFDHLATRIVMERSVNRNPSSK